MTKKELARRIFDRIYTEGRLDEIGPTHDEHCKLRDPSRDTVLEGPEAVRRYVESLRMGFPDFAITVERQIEEKELVASQILCHGTHRGNFMGMKPTNRSVNVRATVVHRFHDEVVMEADVMWDVLSLLSQMGLKPAEAIHSDLVASTTGEKVGI